MSMSRMENKRIKRGTAIKNYIIKNIWKNDDYIVTLDIELENGVVLKDAKMEITKEEILEWRQYETGEIQDLVKAALGFYYGD
ncbi:hypothetical protein [Peribacillus sp. SCS-155]|uniref:hypothetical protein n=1 Tax=Peribacillus sedimenti TaxID=3115297 RepID=UPI0039061341